MQQQRQCIVLEGDADWCRASSQLLLEEFNPANVIAFSSYDDHRFLTTHQKQAQQQLGKEFDAVIFDATEELNPDSLGVILGTIKAGGVLILWIGQEQKVKLWQQRFYRIISEFEQQYESFVVAQQGQSLPQLSLPLPRVELDQAYLTDDQQQAVAAITKVVHGHRRRPLVLSSDRGRGKSASLGIAAAQLLREGKQTILVTAPSLKIAETLFEHAYRLLLPEAEYSAGSITLADAEIKFIAPDELIELDFKADLVLVDEAAAIPAPMLEKLLQKYSRLVFATTLHGYEGTGRGFAVRFQQILEQQAPSWQSFRMEVPIRWAADDELENFSFQSLLLNASPVADELIINAHVDLCQFELVDRQALVNDEQNLRELFGLMVLAHYRTRPSDLQMLLDRDDISVYVMRYQDHIIASAWVVNEGGLDDDLAQAIHAGERRLKGHLLPQSLLAHVGITEAGSLSYQRIIRIAVHPAIQQRNIGSQLLNYIVEHSIINKMDIVGASFGSDIGLLNFWAKSGFIPVRLGIQKDDVSASHSVMMLRSTSELGAGVLNDAVTRFQQHWPTMLNGYFKYLDPALVIAISQLLQPQNVALSLSDINDISAFALHKRGIKFSQFSLNLWLQKLICQPEFLQLSVLQQQLCVMSVLQQRAWPDIIQRLSLTGKSQGIIALREAISVLTSTLPAGK